MSKLFVGQSLFAFEQNGVSSTADLALIVMKVNKIVSI